MNSISRAEPNLIASFELTNPGTEEDPVFQFVYATQVYGSLFGMYARFKITDLGDKCSLDEMTLKILNYQGVINIGFTSHDVLIDTTGAEPKIYFGVMGASLDYEKIVPIKHELTVPKGGRLQVIYCRILYPLADFASTIDLSAGRDVHNALKDPIPVSPLFDSEFQARSGLDYFNNPLRPGMVGYDGFALGNTEYSSKIASIRCTQSIVNLLFR
ncbi:MAG TPA: hypothetical protein VF141_10775 [Chryseolinea sp.]